MQALTSLQMIQSYNRLHVHLLQTQERCQNTLYWNTDVVPCSMKDIPTVNDQTFLLPAMAAKRDALSTTREAW